MAKEIAVPRLGAQYLIDGMLHEVIQLDDVVTLSTVTQLRPRYIRLDSFMSDLERRNITLFADQPGCGSKAIAFLHADDPKVIEAKRKKRYIVTALAEQGNHLPEQGTQTIIQRIALETQDPHPPGYSTLCRWVAGFRANHNDEFSLYKSPSMRPRGRQLSAEVQAQLDKSIKTLYLERQERLAVHRIFQDLDGWVLMINRQRAGSLEPLLRCPSRSTVVRAIAKISGYATDRAHLGAAAAHEKHKFNGLQDRAAAPLEVCEMDSHPLDILVVDQHGRVLGKIAYLSVILDLHSLMVIGWDLSLTYPCAEKTLKALRMAVVAVAGEEHQRGVMVSLVSDGGPENVNSSVATVLDHLGIKWTLPPPKSPNARARIERWFKTFELWLHDQPGTTFSNPEACGDYDSARFACYTIKQLQDYFRDWLENGYHNLKHDTLNMPPRVAWERAMANQLPPRKFPPEAFDALVRGIAYSALSGNRAQFLSLSWTGPNLGRIRAKLRKGEEAICYYDPTDLGTIWVAAPGSPDDRVPAWGTARDYQPGLTLSEHNLLKAQLKAEGQQFDDREAHLALRNLRQRMQEDREQFLTRKKSKRGRPRQAAASASPAAVEPGPVDAPWDEVDSEPWRVD